MAHNEWIMKERPLKQQIKPEGKGLAEEVVELEPRFYLTIQRPTPGHFACGPRIQQLVHDGSIYSIPMAHVNNIIHSLFHWSKTTERSPLPSLDKSTNKSSYPPTRLVLEIPASDFWQWVTIRCLMVAYGQNYSTDYWPAVAQRNLIVSQSVSQWVCFN